MGQTSHLRPSSKLRCCQRGHAQWASQGPDATVYRPFAALGISTGTDSPITPLPRRSTSSPIGALPGHSWIALGPIQPSPVQSGVHCPAPTARCATTPCQLLHRCHRSLQQQVRRQHCGTEPRCFMTGGAGWKMAPSLSVPFELVDNLIFDGLMQMAHARQNAKLTS